MMNKLTSDSAIVPLNHHLIWPTIYYQSYEQLFLFSDKNDKIIIAKIFDFYVRRTLIGQGNFRVL